MTYFLTTDRLGFRHWTFEDRDFAVALWTSPDVMRHMGGPMTAAEAEARLTQEIAHHQRHGFQYWPIFSRETGEHAGCAGLHPFHDRLDLLVLGVHLARPFWSGRLGEEAARAVVAYAWQNTNAEALTAGHGPENIHSKSLIERLGFRYTHHEPWGPQDLMHPYYRLDRPVSLTAISRR